MNYASKWEQAAWMPKIPVLEPSSERLSAAAGIAPVIDMFTKDFIFQEIKNHLPARVGNNSSHSLYYFLVLVAAFLVGYDCLDDIEGFQNCPVAGQMFGKIRSPHAFGDFLRDFTWEDVSGLRGILKSQANHYRERLNLSDKPVTFGIDSTDHEHHGDTIEGLEINYKGKWCLDSLEVFDELGFCYDFDLRPGATFSSVGAPAMMLGILRDRPVLPIRPFDQILADSAFCNEDFIKVCLAKKLKGTITAHDNIGWSKQVDFITNWKPWIYTREEIKQAIDTGVSLPQVHVGYYMYRPGWAPHISFPVVIKKTFRPYEKIRRKKRAEMIKEGKDPRQGLWVHYAVLSLMGLYPRTPQEILEYHKGRSNLENMIKEDKIALDLRHFPCKPMTANHDYALIGLIAHNFLRFMALMDNREKPQFAKALRKRFICIPGKIVYGQSKVKLRIPLTHFKEVHRMLERWAAASDPPLSVA